jgi:hypothetical protein
MVFLGDATLRVSAPDEIEASQLEFFTGSRRLSEDVVPSDRGKT